VNVPITEYPGKGDLEKGVFIECAYTRHLSIDGGAARKILMKTLYWVLYQQQELPVSVTELTNLSNQARGQVGNFLACPVVGPHLTWLTEDIADTHNHLTHNPPQEIATNRQQE
jgi:hypothetical protein